MTIMQMIQQGSVVNLLIMAAIFAVIGIMLSALASGIRARDAQAALPAAQPEQKTNNMPAVTAAITAAVKEFKRK